MISGSPAISGYLEGIRAYDPLGCESTDAVWKRLVEKQADVFGVRAAGTSRSETEPLAESVPHVIIPPVGPISAHVTQLVMFRAAYQVRQQLKVTRRPSTAITTTAQLTLFRP
jgi:hypothetical protein